ncbi:MULTISPECIES: TonB-dependent siderophore receptor [Methylobacterium]|uniref:TonB-dependent siderophore receptor n=1 Tax=Methylobacterium TaxID=407 RepID=UPI0009EADEFC|nr:MULTISPECIES: TonB-dependent siderophore receptor [Methylobacterium]MCI9879551.1 TonB-dependent siderophore receptor [Methylobacterium goesingense]
MIQVDLLPASCRSARPGRRIGAAGVSALALAAMVPALGCATALAQGAGGTAAVQLETLSVAGSGTGIPAGTASALKAATSYVVPNSNTGTKTDTPLREVPQSVSVVTQKQIEDRGVQNLADALGYSAGVVTSPQGQDGRFDQLIIRGFDQTQRGIYKDGLRLPQTSFSGFPIEPYGVERIDVLRGPSSGLFGLNDPGGLVNFITKKPLAVPYREIFGGYGSFNRKQFGFDLSGPVNPEKTILYRVTGLLREGGTQVDDAPLDRIYIAPAVTFAPSADTSLTLLGNYQKDRTGDTFRAIPRDYTNGSNPYRARLRSRFLGEPNFSRFLAEHFEGGYQFSHRFDDSWTVRQNLRYAHASTDYNAVYATDSSPAAPNILGRSAQTWLEEYGVFTVDTQLQHDSQFGRIKNTALVGVDYSKINNKSNQFGGPSAALLGAGPLVGPLDILNPVYGTGVATLPQTRLARIDQEQVGLYAQDQVKFDDRWVLSLNGRYDWVTTKTTATNPPIDAVRQQLDAFGIPNAIPAVFGANQDAQAFSGRAGLSYLFDNGLTPYVSAARSFNVLPVYVQQSTTQTIPGLGAIPTSYNILPPKPERGETIEAGVKFQPPGAASSILFSVFDTKKTNALTFDPTDPLQQAFYQVGEISVKGFETEATVDLLNGFKLISSATVLSAEVTKDEPPAGALSAVGRRPIQVPNFTAATWADYTVQDGPFRGLGLGAGFRYVGASFGDPQNTIRVPDYFLVDAAIRYQYENWRFQVAANNLLDRVFVGTCSQQIGFVGCNYGEGRRVTGTVSYRW